MPARLRHVPALVIPAVLAVTVGCSSDDAEQTVSVTITDSGCRLDSTTLDAVTTAFKVRNDSGREAEAYVYTSSGDKVDEVEHIADGTSRTLTVSLDPGDYEFACKPENADVRTDFTAK